MNTPKISVIIPVYNVEKYLQQCIDSLMAQTQTDVEYIFVNDASTDNCLSILQKNEQKYPQLKVIDSKKNLKQGGARNLGILVAQGDYVGFCDSDDYCLPEMYASMYNQAVKANADAVFIHRTVIPENAIYPDQGSEIPLLKWDLRLQNLDSKQLTNQDKELLMVLPIGGVNCGLWKKSVIVDNAVFFPEGMRYEDNFWISLIMPYLNMISLVERIGYCYRLNPKSTIHSRNQKYITDRIIVENSLLDETKKRGLFREYFSGFEYCYIYRYLANTFFAYVKLNDYINYSIPKKLSTDLKSTFPDWQMNPYYRTEISYKRKIMIWLAVNFPTITAHLFHFAFWILKQKMSI